MARFVTVLCVCFMAFQAFSQSASKWQVGTITDVRIHQTAEKAGASEATSYDVSVKVGDSIYVVLYTPPLRVESVKYAGGRELLVLVGKSSIRYNDMLGQAYEAPIESQRPAANANGSKASLSSHNKRSMSY
jgi:hypothetical protein